MFTSITASCAAGEGGRYEMTGGTDGGQNTGYDENQYGSIDPDPPLWIYPGSGPNNRIEDLIHNASAQAMFFAMLADSGGSPPNTNANWRELRITGEFTTGQATEVYVRSLADSTGTSTNRRTWNFTPRAAKFLSAQVYQVELVR